MQLKILVSNDDGISSPGLRILAEHLSKVGEVIVVAPDKEQSAVGTAVTLRKPLAVQKIVPFLAGIDGYAVEGTPSDSVIIGLGKIIQERIDLVISGINLGSNLGEDVLISGTVGAAMAAYLRGFPAIAVSGDRAFLLGQSTASQGGPDNPAAELNISYLKDISRFTALLVQRFRSAGLSGSPFLNVNIPGRPICDVKGIKITRLARKSHVNTVEESENGQRDYYMLVRQSVNHQADSRTDIRAVEEGNISITPLNVFFNDRLPASLIEKLTEGLLEELKSTNR